MPGILPSGGPARGGRLRHGKEYDPSKEKGPNKPKFDPRLLTPQQLDIVEYALKLMVQATRAPGGVDDHRSACSSGPR